MKFRCKICGYLYSRKDTLKDHIRGKHNARFSTQELNQLVDTVTPNTGGGLPSINNNNNNINNNNAIKNKENANALAVAAAAAAALGAATPLSAMAVNGINGIAPTPPPPPPPPTPPPNTNGDDKVDSVVAAVEADSPGSVDPPPKIDIDEDKIII